MKINLPTLALTLSFVVPIITFFCPIVVKRYLKPSKRKLFFILPSGIVEANLAANEDILLIMNKYLFLYRVGCCRRRVGIEQLGHNFV